MTPQETAAMTFLVTGALRKAASQCPEASAGTLAIVKLEMANAMKALPDFDQVVFWQLLTHPYVAEVPAG